MMDMLPIRACMANDPHLIWLHAIADIIFLLAYGLVALTASALIWRTTGKIRLFVISVTLIVVGDATTYLFNFLSLWNEHYWNAGLTKMISACLSLALSVLVGPMLFFQVGPAAREEASPPTVPPESTSP